MRSAQLQASLRPRESSNTTSSLPSATTHSSCAMIGSIQPVSRPRLPRRWGTPWSLALRSSSFRRSSRSSTRNQSTGSPFRVCSSSTQIMAVAYNIYRANPFSVYGQTLLITIQMIVIHTLFIIFDGKKRTLYVMTLVPVLGLFWAAFHPIYFPLYILENTIIVQILLFSGARLSQIYEIHRIGSTGSLSIITCGLTVLGNMARMATALVQVSGDLKYLFSVVIALVLNSYILGCFFFFKEKAPPKQAADTKKE